MEILPSLECEQHKFIFLLKKMYLSRTFRILKLNTFSSQTFQAGNSNSDFTFSKMLAVLKNIYFPENQGD